MNNQFPKNFIQLLTNASVVQKELSEKCCAYRVYQSFMFYSPCALNFAPVHVVSLPRPICRRRSRFICSINPQDGLPPSDANNDPSWKLLTQRVSQLREKEVTRDRRIAQNWRAGKYSQSVVAALADDYVRRISFRGDFLVCGSATGTTSFFHIPSGKCLQRSDIHVGQVTAVHYSGSYFASAGATDHTLAIWACDSFESPRFWSGLVDRKGQLPPPTFSIEAHNDIITKIVINPQENRIYTASIDGFVRVRNLDTGTIDMTIHVGEPVLSMVLTEKNYLLVGCTSGRVLAYQAQRGLFLLSIQCHRAHTTAIDFYEDNQTLVTGDSSGCIRVWSFRDSTCLGEFSNHKSAIMSLQVDNSKIVSAGRDGCVNVSSLTDFQRLYTISGFTKYITTASFDETRLISDGSNDVVFCHRFDGDSDSNA